MTSINQHNTQDIEHVDDGSSAGNNADKNFDVKHTDIFDFEAPEENSADQENNQVIEHVDDGSEASNAAENNAEIDNGSDNNNLGQDNGQRLKM